MSRFDGALEGAADAALGLLDGAAAVAAAPSSPTVLEVDRWGRRQAERMATDWAGAGLAPVDAAVCADAHTALFEPAPEPASNPADASRAAWWRALMETPEYRALHRETTLDAGMSGLAARSLCDQWAAYAASRPEPKPGGSEPGSDDEPIGQQMARLRSVAKALDRAKEEVETAKDAAAGLGMGAPGAPLDPAALARWARRAAGDRMLKAILAMAGRMRRLCEALQATKTTAERGEIAGIELSGDIARLVPSELAGVAGIPPESELLALYRLATRRCLSYRQKRRDLLAAGPIVVSVDESGSMSGDKIAAAKGLALALAWLARRQNRWCALVGFAGGPDGTRLVIPPDRPAPEALADWATHFYGGGTTLDVPLAELPARYWPEFVRDGLRRGKTDVIIITDAIVDAPEPMIVAYRDWARAEEVRTYSIVVGERDAGDLAKASDRVWTLPRLDLDADATREVLSI